MARVRDDFLASGQVGPAGLVRETIQASWIRSLQFQVDTDRLEPAFVDEHNIHTPLALSAATVLRQLADELANEPVSIILTDAQGLVLQRVCGDSSLLRAMDSAQLAAGFSYAEAHVGTNGIGTALECRAPTMVHGKEHFTNDLGGFTCAGAPILHPITGTLMGILDLTSLAKDSSSLLLVIAKSTARRIQQQLLSQASAGDLALFTDYLSACQHTGGSVLARNEDLVMMNNRTQRLFDARDQAALLARSSDAAGTLRPMTLLADLPSGLTVRLEYRPAFAGQRLAGGVFRIQPTATATKPPTGPRTLLPLPGVAGTSAVWQRASQAVVNSHDRGEWLILEGEAGVGKLTLLRGAHQLRSPADHFRVIDAATAQDGEAWLDSVAEELAGDQGTLVLARLHLLPPQMVLELSAMLLEARARHTADNHMWVTMTMCVNPRNPYLDTQLVPHFPQTIEVPPLRHHMEDLRKLVPLLLGRISGANALTVSSGAMNQLMRLPWQGNVEHLRQMLLKVAQQRRMGVVEVDDLPAECRATSRRQLTQLEALERDAIVTALVTHSQSKVRAARDLGMSRATIYRKIHDYGISFAPEGDPTG